MSKLPGTQLLCEPRDQRFQCLLERPECDAKCQRTRCRRRRRRGHVAGCCPRPPQRQEVRGVAAGPGWWRRHPRLHSFGGDLGVWAGTPRVTLGSNYPRWVSEISLVAQLLLLVKSSHWSTSDNQPPESPSAQELRNTDVEKVGGKSASLGEMISQLSDVGVPVPGLSAVKGLDLIYLMDLEGNQPITIRKSRPKKQEILEIYIITKDKWLKHT